MPCKCTLLRATIEEHYLIVIIIITLIINAIKHAHKRVIVKMHKTYQLVQKVSDIGRYKSMLQVADIVSGWVFLSFFVHFFRHLYVKLTFIR